MAGTKLIFFSFIVIALVVIGVLDVVTNNENNRCEMTYMFQQPEYLRIPMKKSVNQKFPHYGLYVYGEGNYARMLSSMKMTGIPVLFIPGNAGSHKQVRSLGSVAFRRAVDKVKRYHFNFFAVSLNEEFSGLYGAPVKEQTDFVYHAIKKIFALYKHADVQPKTILLVGHSMGGVIARALFMLPNFDAQWVNTIFMQATPNQGPVVVVDGAMSDFYSRVNSYWQDHSNTTLDHVTLVSVGGGEYDVQVREGLTPLDGIVDENHGISTSTTAMPKAWVSADHRCVVWCKQVVMGFARALFDIVDEKEKQITDDKEHRMSVFRHHFLHHPGTGGPVGQRSGDVTLHPDTPWTLMSDSVWKWEQDRVSSDTYLVMPVMDSDESVVDHVTIVSNIPRDSWVCACELQDGESQCPSCSDLSWKGNVIPPLYSNKKAVHLDLSTPELVNMTHIVVMVPETEKKVEITAEKYTRDKRHLSNTVPGLFDTLMSLPESVTKGAMVLDLGTAASYYRLKLYGLTNVVKVYTARLETSRCAHKTPADEHAGNVMQFHVPWSNEDTYTFIKYGESGHMKLKLQSVPPAPVIPPVDPDFPFPPLEGDNYDHVELILHLDPSCHYRLALTASFKEMLGQFVRFYGLLLPTFCVATLLIALVYQLRVLATDGVFPSVLDSILQIRPYTVVPFALLLQVLLQLKVLQPYVELLTIPAPDAMILEKQGLMFRLAQLLLYLLAVGVTTFQALVVTLVVQFNSRLLGLVFGWLPGIITRLGKLVGVLLCLAGVGLSVTVCGSIGIFVCYIVCFIQVLRLCYLSRRVGDRQTKSQYNFFLLLFLVWMWLVIINSPALLIWGKMVIESQKLEVLQSDPSRVTGTVSASIFVCLLLCSPQLSGRVSLRPLRITIHALTVLMLVFAMVHLYRITYFILASLALLSIPLVCLRLKDLAFPTPRPKTE